MSMLDPARSPQAEGSASAFPPSPDHFRGLFHLREADRSPFAGASGILYALPDAVAVPADAEDVCTLVRWAADSGTPLVPRGAGTGMPGGNVGRGVLVDLVPGLCHLYPVDAAARRVRIQPGITLGNLNRACAGYGLHFPVDPSSAERATLGGMLANNSAGAHSVRYGATRAWTEALDVVLADGTTATARRGQPPEHPRLRSILAGIDRSLLPARERILAEWPRVRKNSSGYALCEYLRSCDAVDLLVGSEGTLALIVGAELRLAPTPACRGLALLEFTTLEAAGAAVESLLPLQPSTCEILDRTFLDLVRDAGADPGYPLRPGLEAILLVEMEADSAEEVAEALQRVAAAAAGLADRISLASDLEQQARFWKVRHAASPLIAARTDGLVSMQFIEDGVVPVSRLPDYLLALRRTLARHDTPAVIFGHAGDGNLHVNPLVDVRAAGWRSTVERILYQITDVIAELGGTMAGEHGDGRLRAPLLDAIWGAEMVAHFRAVKTAWDPTGIFNPGAILPLPGQQPLDALRTFPNGV